MVDQSLAAFPPTRQDAMTPVGKVADQLGEENVDKGACSGGLMITELPAASGAEACDAANKNGWL